MNNATNQGEVILGILASEFPEGCRKCPRLAAYALMHPDIDLTEQASYPRPSNSANVGARLLFSRMGNMCLEGVDDDGSCGSIA